MIELTYQPNNWPTNKEQHNGDGNLLVLDASFNPPTQAHTALIDATIQHFPPSTFESCLLLFTTNNVDKQLVGASASQRLDMMTLVAQRRNNEHQQTIPTAVGVTTHGRFIDKATALQSLWPRKTFYFIVGYDTVIRLLDPAYYPEKSVDEALAPFFEHCKLVSVDRAGYGDMESFWASKSAHGIERVVLKDEKVAALSSTLARSMDRGQLETAVDADVAEYIRKHALYL
ncbi:hypothetical protein BDB00DRAFT_802789 [Zychaea mexicana]|uniref:uncharacterized protein n=1 Tax=Zychaea mexicana TaxID=64656 RepID=UPI0022FE91D1|nr:uncharacterized protein BDB00DRAFT_802789 [Zychaea mexicana]KAI9497966.1 hypothetical protein BDB00DRAFT_802789 [Zychaea mexicana]